MKNTVEVDYRKKIITIPNVLSFFRLCLIPIIVWLYCFEKNYKLTTLILMLSGFTDIADGIIARKFNMISDFGKAFDPAADKLTQFAMLICLVTRFKHMMIPLCILVVKEILTAIMSLLAIRKTSVVMGAVWHGKVTTFLLYTMMIIHLVWFNIPSAVSDGLVAVCTFMMIISAFLYGVRNFKMLTGSAEAARSNA